MGNVYCCNCKWHKSNIQPWQSVDCDDLCKKKLGKEIKSVGIYEYYLTCAEANKKNKCKLFEPSLWFRIKKMLRKYLMIIN